MRSSCEKGGSRMRLCSEKMHISRSSLPAWKSAARPEPFDGSRTKKRARRSGDTWSAMSAG